MNSKSLNLLPVFLLSVSCVLWPRLHFLLPGGKAAVFHGSGSRSQLASLRRGAASVQRHDDRAVPYLRLQTPLARSVSQSHQDVFPAAVTPPPMEEESNNYCV